MNQSPSDFPSGYFLSPLDLGVIPGKMSGPLLMPKPLAKESVYDASRSADLRHAL
jgi:hypothetical protein